MRLKDVFEKLNKINDQPDIPYFTLDERIAANKQLLGFVPETQTLNNIKGYHSHIFDLMSSGIYVIMAADNDSIPEEERGKIYIGKAVCILDRLMEHARAPENDSKMLHRKIREYGRDKFLFTILEINDGIDIASEADLDTLNKALFDSEQKWIHTYNSLFENGSGYNCTAGGNGGTKLRIPFKDIHEIRKELAKPDKTMTEIAAEYKIDRTTVAGINYGSGIYGHILPPKGSTLEYPIRSKEYNLAISKKNLSSTGAHKIHNAKNIAVYKITDIDSEGTMTDDDINAKIMSNEATHTYITDISGVTTITGVGASKASNLKRCAVNTRKENRRGDTAMVSNGYKIAVVDYCPECGEYIVRETSNKAGTVCPKCGGQLKNLEN